MDGSTVGQGGRMARHERLEQIMDTLKGQDMGLTTHAIARRMGLAPSPHVRSMVYELFVSERVVGERRLMKNKRYVYVWYDAANTNRKHQGQLFHV